VALCFLLDFVGYATGWPLGVGKPVMDLIVEPVKRELEVFDARRVAQAVEDLLKGTAAARSVDALRDIEVELDVAELARKLGPLLGIAPRDLVPGSPRYVPLSVRIPPLRLAILIHEAQRLLGHRGLAAMNVTEAMMVYMKVTLACGLVLGSPWVFWQLWSFVAAGLYAHERRYVYRWLPFSVALFVGGVLICQFAVIPPAVESLLGFNAWLGIDPDLRLSEWLSFALLLPLVFGLAFQTPLVMVVLHRIDVASAATYRKKRSLAWFLLAAFAAVVTPSADYLSMLFLWLSLGLLYEIGILLCRTQPIRKRDGALAGSADLVEV